MAIKFGAPFEATAPDGAVVGIAGEEDSGQRALPDQAEMLSTQTRRLGPGSALNLTGARILLLEHALATHGQVARARVAAQLEQLRRDGVTVLLVSHEEDLLRTLCDEVWWLRDGKLAARGHADEVLPAYRRYAAERIRALAPPAKLAPRVRRGDARAAVIAIELLGEDGRPTSVWRSGELAVVRVAVQFAEAVPDPVIGIMIRTRIGLNVYGTNTELERLKVGPCAGGEVRAIDFAFRCELCPGEYTLTAASHDPDGVWHDWLEDAVAFSVTDTRYTAGVANLRAAVSLSRR